jgi:hypothetical protein
MAAKTTSKTAASKAAKTLSNPSATPKQKSAAASALAQTGTGKVTGKSAAYGTHFPSLAQHFQVSEAAMAIRLQELELVNS